MPHTDPAKQRAAEKKWRDANREKVNAKKNAKRDRLKQIVKDAKNVPCTDCGVRYPSYVMDLDHVRGEKVDILNRLVNMGTLQRVLTELEKCEPVCSNCHRERTHQRRINEELHLRGDGIE